MIVSWLSCLVVLGAVAVRVLLFVWGVGLHFTDDPLLGGPLSSASALAEGSHLWHRGLSPYATSICKLPPLAILTLGSTPRATRFTLLLAIDLAAAALLSAVAVIGRGFRPAYLSRSLAGLAYLCAPWAALATAALDFSKLPHCAVLAAFVCASTRRSTLAAASLALATYLSPDSIWLLPPTIALLRPSSRGAAGGGVALFFAGFACWLSALVALSIHAFGSAQFLHVVYGSWASADGLGVNVGLWWYLTVEVFTPMVVVARLNPQCGGSGCSSGVVLSTLPGSTHPARARQLATS